jgi:hypothetical protein
MSIGFFGRGGGCRRYRVHVGAKLWSGPRLLSPGRPGGGGPVKWGLFSSIDNAVGKIGSMCSGAKLLASSMTFGAAVMVALVEVR